MPRYKKRPDGRYRVSISTGMIGPDGKKKRVYVYGKNISELEKKKAKVLMDLDKGIYVFDKNMLFKDYKWKWLELYKDAREENTKNGYKNILKRHTACLDEKKLMDIRRQDVQKGYNALNGHAALQRKYFMTVNQIFKSAIADGLLFKNACDGVEKVRTPKKKKRALTELERTHLFSADFDVQEKLLAYLLFYTGMRRQEIIPLTKNDINLEKRRITVNKAVAFSGEKAILKDTKSYAGEREIFIVDPLKPVLESYLSGCQTPIIFPGSNGRYMTKTKYRSLFDRVKRKLNDSCGGSYHWENGRCVYDVDMCAGLGSHTFRHEYATMLYYSGIDIMEAANMMGHADSRMLLDVYAELRKQEQKSADQLNSYMQEQTDKLKNTTETTP